MMDGFEHKIEAHKKRLVELNTLSPASWKEEGIIDATINFALCTVTSVDSTYDEIKGMLEDVKQYP
jgi:hypothetical protein